MYHVHPSHRRCTSSGRKSQPAVAEYAAGWVAMSLSDCGVSWSKLGALWSKKDVPLDMLNLKLWVCCLKIGNLAGHESSIMLSAFHFSWYPQFPASPKTPWWQWPTNKIWAEPRRVPKAVPWHLTAHLRSEVRGGHGMRLAMKCWGKNISYIWVFPKIGVSPKWMIQWWKTLFFNGMIWGYHFFGNTHISMSSSTASKAFTHIVQLQ